MTGSSGLRRSAVCALVLVPIELIVAACAQHPSVTTTPLATAAVTAAAAKQQMVGAVDDVTGRLGGDWDQGTGPDYADACALPGGQPGAQWVDVRTRPFVGNVTKDLPVVEAHWKRQGMTIDRWGSTAHPTLVGRGGAATDSISLSVADDQYGVQALSRCFPGDPDEL
ncbi:hypothetical protein J2Y89_001212 [Curtobacterium herbarum]|uniref:hypothetical protein n=1 Tax=Curtobacterium herbarum TaxID=150122 RepID=UPI00209CFB4C|nr:hypothetical protein [Curtobacterium herbarum]MCP1502468.1 hypothetical protein [Curtobacterium herbarum]